jgi:hypothetical protein
MAAAIRPPMIAAIAVMATNVSHHGELSSSFCNGSSVVAVTTSLMPLVTPENVPCAQLVTALAALMIGVPTSRGMRTDPSCSDDGKSATSW